MNGSTKNVAVSPAQKAGEPTIATTQQPDALEAQVAQALNQIISSNQTAESGQSGQGDQKLMTGQPATTPPAQIPQGTSGIPDISTVVREAVREAVSGILETLPDTRTPPASEPVPNEFDALLQTPDPTQLTVKLAKVIKEQGTHIQQLRDQLEQMQICNILGTEHVQQLQPLAEEIAKRVSPDRSLTEIYLLAAGINALKNVGQSPPATTTTPSANSPTNPPPGEKGVLQQVAQRIARAIAQNATAGNLSTGRIPQGQTPPAPKSPPGNFEGELLGILRELKAQRGLG